MRLFANSVTWVSAAYKIFAVNESVVAADLLERLMRMHPKYFFNAISASSREGQSVSTQGLGLLRFVLPPKVIQDRFYEVVDPLTRQIGALNQQSNTLAALRDTLLPKLLSGEMSVKKMADTMAKSV